MESNDQSYRVVLCHGGGVAYEDVGGTVDGGSSCVRLSLFLKIDGDTNVNGNEQEFP